jgi:2-oxoglutarate dehydrogenase complex dihydrolipoamide succinyltransferase (E2) component
MPIAVNAPQMGESVLEGTIGKWHKKLGDQVERDDILVEILTDKVTVEVPSAFRGVLGKILVKEGEVVKVGQEMAILLREGETPADLDAAVSERKPAARKPAAATAGADSGGNGDEAPGRVRTSPAVRRLAREHGIDLEQVKATGPQGRVRREDVEALIRQSRRGAARPAAEAAAPAPAQAPTPVRSVPLAAVPGKEQVERTPLAGVRKLIADHMVHSKHTSPHVMTMDEVDLTQLVDFRKRHKDRILQQYGISLTYMPFFIKAVTAALKNHPTMNASITADEIIVRRYYHIGVAVARESGLIVPVVKHADTKSILQLAAELADLADRARREKLSPDDVQGGTFTLTNAGMFGALASTPIINQPQVAIMGMHAIQKRPVVRNDQIVARDMMYLTVSFDHRLIDGHTAVQFLREVCVNLEEPANMLLT